MTLAQIRLFSESIDFHNKTQLRDAVIAALAGARYDEKSLKKLFKDLQ